MSEQVVEIKINQIHFNTIKDHRRLQEAWTTVAWLVELSNFETGHFREVFAQPGSPFYDQHTKLLI